MRKKLVFMLIAALSVALTGCSAFDSDPIEPNIIGTGNLQYEPKSGTWFVAVDSTQYTITNVTILDHNLRSFLKTRDIEPVEEMLVTIFTSPRMTGIQVVTGRQTVEQIEELYRTNATGAFILCGILILCVIGIVFVPRTEEVPKAYADE